MSAQPQGSPLSRREMFGRFFRPFRAVVQPDSPPTAPIAETIAVIAGRHCLAYQGTGCSVCHERCPVAGAIVVEKGLPRIVAEICTGCRICHDVCPAPENAVKLVPRPPGMKKLDTTDGRGNVSSPFPRLPGGENSHV